MQVQIQSLFRYASKVRNYIFHGNYYPFQKEEQRFIFDLHIGCIQAIEHLKADRNKDRTIFDDSLGEFRSRLTHFDQQSQRTNVLNFQPAELLLNFETAY
jgi:hypothetical protein